jgi:hypothetical protein
MTEAACRRLPARQQRLPEAQLRSALLTTQPTVARRTGTSDARRAINSSARTCRFSPCRTSKPRTEPPHTLQSRQDGEVQRARLRAQLGLFLADLCGHKSEDSRPSRLCVTCAHSDNADCNAAGVLKACMAQKVRDGEAPSRRRKSE